MNILLLYSLKVHKIKKKKKKKSNNVNKIQDLESKGNAVREGILEVIT